MSLRILFRSVRARQVNTLYMKKDMFPVTSKAVPSYWQVDEVMALEFRGSSSL